MRARVGASPVTGAYPAKLDTHPPSPRVRRGQLLFDGPQLGGWDLADDVV